MNEVINHGLKGHIRIYQQDEPDNVLFSADNIIVNGVKSLFARLMADRSEPMYGVWGLAIGAGHSSWSDPTTQPDATAVQTALWDEIRRKRCSYVRFLDNTVDRNPISGFSEVVDFQTIINATTDNVGRPIREMGLIGGGSAKDSTNMASASTPFWDPVARDPNSTTLINYKTLPNLELPPGINFIFSWMLSFVFLLVVLLPATMA